MCDSQENEGPISAMSQYCVQQCLNGWHDLQAACPPAPEQSGLLKWPD